MMFFAVVVSTSLAFEPVSLPERPEPPPAMPGCLNVHRAMEDVPAPCTGILVPGADYADLLATEVWARQLELEAHKQIAVARAERDQAAAEAEWWKAQASEATPGFWQRPATQRVIGGGMVLFSVGASAYMLHGISEL